MSLRVSSFWPCSIKTPVSISNPTDNVLELLLSHVPSRTWSAWESLSEGNSCSRYFFLGSQEATLNTYLQDFFSPYITLCLAGVIWKTCAVSKLAFHTLQTNSCAYSRCSQNSQSNFSSWTAFQAIIGKSLCPRPGEKGPFV